MHVASVHACMAAQECFSRTPHCLAAPRSHSCIPPTAHSSPAVLATATHTLKNGRSHSLPDLPVPATSGPVNEIALSLKTSIRTPYVKISKALYDPYSRVGLAEPLPTLPLTAYRPTLFLPATSPPCSSLFHLPVTTYRPTRHVVIASAQRKQHQHQRHQTTLPLAVPTSLPVPCLATYRHARHVVIASAQQRQQHQHQKQQRAQQGQGPAAAAGECGARTVARSLGAHPPMLLALPWAAFAA
jgi:hypothetical protein